MSEMSMLVPILGCPRSGTTMVQAQLARHFDLTAISETHFIPIFQRFSGMWKNGKTEESRRSLVEALQEFTKIRWGITYGYSVDEIKEMGVLSTLEDEAFLLDDNLGYGAILERLYKQHAYLKGSRGVIEKFSYYHPVHVDYLARIFPEAKFIHVLRDGRDVIMSWQKTWFGPKTMREAALRWKAHVDQYTAWGKKNSDRYLEIEFSDMLKREEETLARISTFLGLPVKGESGFQGKVFEMLAEQSHYEKSKAKPDDLNDFKWPRQMSVEDAAFFWAIAGDTASEKGYHSSSECSFSFRWRCFKESVFAFIHNGLDPVLWKRRLMWLLPLFIKLSQVFGISLYGLLKRFKS